MPSLSLGLEPASFCACWHKAHRISQTQPPSWLRRRALLHASRSAGLCVVGSAWSDVTTSVRPAALPLQRTLRQLEHVLVDHQKCLWSSNCRVSLDSRCQKLRAVKSVSVVIDVMRARILHKLGPCLCVTCMSPAPETKQAEGAAGRGIMRWMASRAACLAVPLKC